ncbi:unnamed protein product [Lactuca saligna]|uniref:Cytochrome P450 n=1 Tax=Lactuca saligna TaxID=75948 RepID=A0AA35VAP2_LACSI|nr:unnamed protein product [Lactuca saligna]
MELQISFSLLFFVASIFFLFFKSHRSSNSLNTTTKLPPQPWKLPLIGHMHHLTGALPHRALANLAEKLGPVFRLQLGEVSAVVISSSHLAKEVMKTHDLSFADRPKLLSAEIVAYNYKDIAFAPYGEYWRQIRKICTLELLSVKKVQSFRSIREQESWNLIESMAMAMQTSKIINLSEKTFTLLNSIIYRVAVGSRCNDQETLTALLEEVIVLSGGFDVADIFPSVKVLHVVSGVRSKLVKLHMKIDQILDNIVAEHQERRKGGHIIDNEDLVDVLLRLKDDGGLQFPLTSDNVKAVILDMFAGGTHTSAVTIQWAMSELMKNPQVMKKVQAELRHVLKGKNKICESDIQELNYLKLVIKETLRLHPPLPLLLPRESRVECEIGGYHIPANTKVMINVWKIGCDPDYWIDPKSFIPERFSDIPINMSGTDFEFLPFGAGRRMCPGMNLGLINVELPLAMLLHHFNWELPDGIRSEDLDMSETFGASLKRKHELLLVPSACTTN